MTNQSTNENMEMGIILTSFLVNQTQAFITNNK